MELSQSLSVEVYKNLKQRIINYDLMPGQLLMAQEMAKELGMSRTPVREAMVRLREEGFLVEATGRKFRVSSITWKYITDLYHARILLESHSIRQMKNQDNKKFMQEFAENLEQLSENIDRKDYQAIFENDAEFHKLITNCCENSIINDWLNHLHDHQMRIRFISIHADGRVTKTLQEHQDIYQCLKREDYDGAVEKLQLHLNNVLQDLEKSRMDKAGLIHLMINS